MIKVRTDLFVLLFCVAVVTALPAQNFLFTSLVSFNGVDGTYPGYMTLIRGTDGNFYGTTMAGGANFNSICFPAGSGCGTVFKVTPLGAISSLYSFCSQLNCVDGASPWAGLVLGTDGSFYGTTYTGGANNCLGGANNCGTIFRVSPLGAFTLLHTFDGSDGAEPSADLVQVDGNFYGTTRMGGNYGGGTVFKITPYGTLTTLYNFCALANCADGNGPEAQLTLGRDGKFYGTTAFGGNGAGGAGTVFKLTTSGELTTLYTFCSEPNCTDGANPAAGLVQASNGNFYGTTWLGGNNLCLYGCGTIFEINPLAPPQQGMTLMHSFHGYPVDGANPTAGLVQAIDGNFYGTTQAGGANYGTVFKMTPSGALVTLHNFCAQVSCSDGFAPLGGLMQVDRFLYGTTQQGGAHDGGTVFMIPVRPTYCTTCRTREGTEKNDLRGRHSELTVVIRLL